MFKVILVSLLFCFSFLSSNVSAENYDELVGTYATDYYGKMKDMYRIEKNGDKYTFFENKIMNSQWVWQEMKVEITPVSKTEFEASSKMTIDGPFMGLSKQGRTVIFKAKKGFTLGNFTTKTGYFSFAFDRLEELEKTK